MGKIIDIYKIVSLFRRYKKYDKYKYSQIVDEILPSINLNQYKLHYKNNELIGFTNWALLNDTVAERFNVTGILKPNEWKCGENLWHIYTIAIDDLKSIIDNTKKLYANKFGVGKSVKWLRLKDNYKILNTTTTKESWLNIYG